jgi:hypothetical protein
MACSTTHSRLDPVVLTECSQSLVQLQADLDLLQEDLSVIELRKESLASTREKIGLRKDVTTWDGQSKGVEVGLPLTGTVAATAAKKRRVFMQVRMMPVFLPILEDQALTLVGAP